MSNNNEERALSNNNEERRVGYNQGVAACITWLHDRAKSMNDLHATALLNSAAFDLGHNKPERYAARTEASAPPKEEVERLTERMVAIDNDAAEFERLYHAQVRETETAEVQLSDIREQIAYFGAVDPSDSLQADVRDTCKALIDTAQKFLAQRDGLLEALNEWKCPSCGGSKVYMQRGVGYPSEGIEVPCKVCEETGLCPRAKQARDAYGASRT